MPKSHAFDFVNDPINYQPSSDYQPSLNNNVLNKEDDASILNRNNKDFASWER